MFITCSQERKGDRRGREALLKLFLLEPNDFFVWRWYGAYARGGVWALATKTLTDDGGLVL